MALSYTDLSPAERNFSARVEMDLRGNWDDAQVSIIGDGSASPEGYKFAAVREGNSWRVIFDFNRGQCYETAVQLPNDWAAMFRRGLPPQA